MSETPELTSLTDRKISQIRKLHAATDIGGAENDRVETVVLQLQLQNPSNLA